jgi:exopolysaccharide biosynthesis polyprenyl glycosylphosphotransferase
MTGVAGALRPPTRRLRLAPPPLRRRPDLVTAPRIAWRLAELLLVAVAAALLWPGDPQVLAVLIAAMSIALLSGRETRMLPGRVDDGLMRALGKLALVGVAAAIMVPAQTQGVVRVAGAAILLVAMTRIVVTRVRGRLHRGGHLLTPTLILGAGPTGQLMGRTLAGRPEYGLRPVGFVDRLAAHEELPQPWLGSPETLNQILHEHRVGCVILSFGVAQEADLVEVMRNCDAPHVRFFVLPRFFELGLLNEDGVADVRGFPLVPLRLAPRRPRAKRWFDVGMTAALLFVTLPLLAFSALAVRLSGPGPILFRQERVGRDGLPFEMLKLRTMHLHEEGDRNWAPDEDRVTAAGRFLRPTHLDELPQLINVLRGEMSLVGPRPERPVFVEEFGGQIPRYLDRHRVPAGLTGLAQVNGLWGDSSIEERARYDNRYIESWTLRRDLAILLRTFPTLLGQRDEGPTWELATEEAGGPST